MVYLYWARLIVRRPLSALAGSRVDDRVLPADRANDFRT